MALEGPAQTFNYMLLGYGVILGCIAVLLISMLARYRSLQRDLHMLDELETRASGRAIISYQQSHPAVSYRHLPEGLCALKTGGGAHTCAPRILRTGAACRPTNLFRLCRLRAEG
jgi:hypothetical protein